MASLILELLGGLQVRTGDGLPVAIPAKKSRALLAYLAMAPGRPHSRDKLAALLWADRAETPARTSLRQALAGLRRALPADGAAILRADGDTVALDADALDAGALAVDVVRFEHLLADGSVEALEQAAALYRGDLLDGFLPRAPEFEDWMRAERMRLREAALAAQDRLLAARVEAGDSEAAVRIAAHLLSLDPLREPAHRALMRLHAGRGRHADALHQYRVCRDALQRELGVPPEPETEALHREIRQHRRIARPAPADALAAGPAVAAVDERPAPPAVAAAAPALREATVLFCGLADFGADAGNLDPEDVGEILTAYFGVTDRIVDAFGGTVVKHVGDTVMAVFGIPVAHGNDTERALRAALAIHRSLADAGERIGRRVQIGIANGPVVTGELGGDRFREQTVAGEAVTLAARLATRAAAGETLVTPAVRLALQPRLIGARPADGGWSVDGLTDDGGDGRPLVGRDTERRLFASLLDSALAGGHGQMMAVRGEAGIGKSRLIEAFAGLAAERGVRCAAVPVFDFGGEFGLDAVLSLTEALLGLKPGADPCDRRAALDRAVAEGLLPDDLRLFAASLLRLPLDDEAAARYGAMDNAARTRGGLQAVTTLFRAVAGRAGGLVLAVEDVHWADARTLAHLAAIGSVLDAVPALLVMTTRDDGDPLDAAWRATAGDVPLATVDLPKLTELEAWTLAEQADCADPVFRQSCIARAGGNPLFLDQLLRHPPAPEGAPPGSIRSLVLARLDRLDAADRQALEAGSVLGTRFSLETLRHLTGDPDYLPRGPLSRALIRAEDDGYRFAHALIRDGVYASILRSRRRALHQQAAAWYAGRNPVLHAEHLGGAGDPQAPPAFLGAARQHAGEYRFEQALGLVESGLAAAADGDVRHELLCLRGDVLRNLGRNDASVEAFRDALTTAGCAARKATAWIGVAHGLRLIDRPHEALEALAKAEAAIEPPGDSRRLAMVHYLRGGIRFPLGEIDACLDDHAAALRHARAAHSVACEADALSGLGDANYLRGRMETAFGYYDACIGLSRAHALKRSETCNLPMRGIVRFYRCDLDGALEDCAAGLALAREIGDERGEMLTRNIVSWVRLDQNAWDEARREAAETRRLAERIGAKRFVPEADCVLAHVLLKTGARDEAARRLEAAYPLAEETGPTYTGAVILGLLALATDDAGRRRDALRDGEALLARGCVSHNYLYFYRYAMAAAAADRQWDAVERYAAALEAYLRPEPLAWADTVIADGRRRAEAGRRGRLTGEQLASLVDLL